MESQILISRDEKISELVQALRDITLQDAKIESSQSDREADDMITASSEFNIHVHYAPQFARLNNQPRSPAIGAWVPKQESK